MGVKELAGLVGISVELTWGMLAYRYTYVKGIRNILGAGGFVGWCGTGGRRIYVRSFAYVSLRTYLYGRGFTYVVLRT